MFGDLALDYGGGLSQHRGDMKSATAKALRFPVPKAPCLRLARLILFALIDALGNPIEGASVICRKCVALSATVAAPLMSPILFILLATGRHDDMLLEV
jgi:hypothetical protein